MSNSPATASATAVGALHHFLVAGPASATANSPFNITVTAQDSSSRTVTGYAGTPVFSSSDAQATLPSGYTFTSGSGKDNGVHTYTNGVTLKTSGTQTITATDGSITGTSSGISVAATTSFSVTPAATSQTAGTAFNVTIQALNNGVNDTSYTGSKCVTFSGPSTSPAPTSKAPTYPAATGSCSSPASTLTFNASGQATASVTLFAAESAALSATDGSRTGSSSAITVAPGSALLGFTGTTVGGTAKTCDSVSAIDVGNNNVVFKTQVQALAKDSWSNTVTLPTTGSVAVTMTLNPTTGFNNISNTTQTITFPTTSSPAASAYSAQRSNGNSYTGTLTAAAGGYVSATCALSHT